MQNNFRCKWDYLISSLKCYVKEHKSFLLCLAAAIVGGFILGIIITSLRENITSRYNYIVLISCEQFNLFGTFIKVVVLALAGFALCYVPIFHRYLACMPYIVLFYSAYRFGGRLVGLVVADKFAGFICIITWTIPLYLVIITSFVAVTCITAYYKLSCGGQGLVCRKTNKHILKCIGCVFACLFVLLIIICIIIPAIAKFIIVV